MCFDVTRRTSHKQSPSRHLARRAFCMQVFDSALARLKCAKNLYLSHRFFYKIRQIHRIFDAFRQNLPILCRNQALSRRSFPAVPAPCSRRPQPGEKPRPLAALPHKKPGIHTKWMPGRNRLQLVRAADLRCYAEL